MTNQKSDHGGRKSDLGLHIQICAVCAERFVTDDARRTLCSRACRADRRTARGREKSRAHRERHPERELCRQTLKNAVLLGKVRRPDRCESCGTAGFVEAHHEDYARPFFVEWLCKSCHERRDMAVGA